jgi:hypothetical protein
MGSFSSRILTRKKRTRPPKNIGASSTSGDSDELPKTQYSKPAYVDSHPGYNDFLRAYPRFVESDLIDDLREHDFTRLSRNAVYLDYMGGGQYPESLIRIYAETLQSNVFGNTHSESTRYVWRSRCSFIFCNFVRWTSVHRIAYTWYQLS